MYRHVFTMYIHICKFKFMYMTRTGIYINVQTCMYICLFVHTWYIHVHTMYVHVWHFLTCMYMLNTCLYRFSKSCPGGQDSRCGRDRDAGPAPARQGLASHMAAEGDAGHREPWPWVMWYHSLDCDIIVLPMISQCHITPMISQLWYRPMMYGYVWCDIIGLPMIS